MKKNSIAAQVLICMTLLVNGLAYAADAPVAVESTKKKATAGWVPEGFESLNEPQVTEIDLYYGDEFLTAVFARFTQEELSFLETDSITRLLKNLSDPSSLNLLLQKPFETNAGKLCHSEFQVDCGTLQPETVAIIFDRATLRADMFISPELLLAGQPLQSRFLPDSSADFSLFTDNAVFFSGTDQDQTTYNFVNTTRIAFGESRLLLRSNYTDTQGLTFDTVALQREYQGKDYQIGLFRGNSANFRFMNSEQFIGASMASSILTRIDLEQSLGTEIELFFGSRSRIEILRDDRLLASGYYDVGNQIIDTSTLPPGSYDIEIRITDGSGAMTTEHRFFSKTSRIPPEDQSIYFLQAGRLTDRSISGGIPELGTSIIRGGFSKRLSPSIGADLGFSTTPDSNMFEAGLFKMGNSYEIKAEVAMEDNGAKGADVAVRWDLDFIRLNISSRKIWEGDSQVQLGEARTQNSVSIDMPSRWGNIGLFARTLKRPDEIEGVNYGLRWQTNSFSAGGGNLSAGLEISKNDDDLLAMFSLSYRFNGSRSQHAFTPAISYETIAAENFRKTSMQGSHMSSWIYGDAEQRRLTLRADHNQQSSVEARFEDQRKFGDTDFTARYNTGAQQLEYSGKLSSSFGYTREASGFGGRARGESAFIVSVDGIPEANEFEVLVNGSARGTTVSGKRLLVPVSPYETYRVELNPLGDSIIDIDDKTYRKTVYPGNVIALNWSARFIKILIGRVVDEAGTPIKGALIRNVKGFGVTDDQGFFQVEVEQSVKSLIIQKGMDLCEADFEIGDASRKVVSLGTLSCIETENPIVRIFPQFSGASDDPDLATTSAPVAEELTTPVAVNAIFEAEDAASTTFANTEVVTNITQSPVTEVPDSVASGGNNSSVASPIRELAAKANGSLPLSKLEQATGLRSSSIAAGDDEALAAVSETVEAVAPELTPALAMTKVLIVDSIDNFNDINKISSISDDGSRHRKALWSRPSAYSYSVPVATSNPAAVVSIPLSAIHKASQAPASVAGRSANGPWKDALARLTAVIPESAAIMNAVATYFNKDILNNKLSNYIKVKYSNFTKFAIRSTAAIRDNLVQKAILAGSDNRGTAVENPWMTISGSQIAPVSGHKLPADVPGRGFALPLASTENNLNFSIKNNRLPLYLQPVSRYWHKPQLRTSGVTYSPGMIVLTARSPPARSPPLALSQTLRQQSVDQTPLRMLPDMPKMAIANGYMGSSPGLSHAAGGLLKNVTAGLSDNYSGYLHGETKIDRERRMQSRRFKSENQQAAPPVAPLTQREGVRITGPPRVIAGIIQATGQNLDGDFCHSQDRGGTRDSFDLEALWLGWKTALIPIVQAA